MRTQFKADVRAIWNSRNSAIGSYLQRECHAFALRQFQHEVLGRRCDRAVVRANGPSYLCELTVHQIDRTGFQPYDFLL